jgi:predicted SAM-dependent methyltransferase
MPGWINVDIRPEVQPDVVADVHNMPMFDDNSASLIYFSHGIEHFTVADVPRLLREWKRILALGGWLYLSVPDFSIMTGLYLSGEVQLKDIVPATMGGHTNHADVHHSIWDMALMRTVLELAGFEDVQRYEPLAFLPENFSDFSLHRIADTWISLNVRSTYQ